MLLLIVATDNIESSAHIIPEGGIHMLKVYKELAGRNGAAAKPTGTQ